MYNEKIKKGNIYQLKKILVAFAGPTVNIILAIIFLNINMEIAYANSLIAVFNLIPIYPLDGGRILRGIFHLIFGNWKAKKYINRVSIVFMVGLTIILCVASYYFSNIAVIVIIIYLWSLVISERIKYQKELNIYNLVKSIENN